MKWSLVFASKKAPEPAQAAHLASIADEAGFAALWAPEHIVIPVEYESEYGFTADGKVDHFFPDPLIWLSFAAAVTKRIRLGTGVIIMPEHNPVIMAKRTATLDQLSQGRFILGLGVGWFREEFDSVGVDFDNRGKRVDEQIEIMRRMWRNDIAEFHGEYYDFQPLRSTPKPAGGALPIHIGGDSKVAARRAGRLGDGFFPAMWPTERVYDELPGLLIQMREAATAAGRDPAAIEVTSGGVRTAEEAKWFADQGVHQLTVTVRARDSKSIKDELLRFSDEVISKTVDL